MERRWFKFLFILEYVFAILAFLSIFLVSILQDYSIWCFMIFAWFSCGINDYLEKKINEKPSRIKYI